MGQKLTLNIQGQLDLAVNGSASSPLHVDLENEFDLDKLIQTGRVTMSPERPEQVEVAMDIVLRLNANEVFSHVGDAMVAGLEGR